jgi:hypothetical protein
MQVGQGVSVDKYGRKVKASSRDKVVKSDLAAFYKVDDDDADNNDSDDNNASDGEHDSDNEADSVDADDVDDDDVDDVSNVTAVGSGKKQQSVANAKAKQTKAAATVKSSTGKASKTKKQQQPTAATDMEARVQYLNAIARGDISGSGSSSDSSSGSDSSSDSEIDDADDAEGIATANSARKLKLREEVCML